MVIIFGGLQKSIPTNTFLSASLLRPASPSQSFVATPLTPPSILRSQEEWNLDTPGTKSMLALRMFEIHTRDVFGVAVR